MRLHSRGLLFVAELHAHTHTHTNLSSHMCCMFFTPLALVRLQNAPFQFVIFILETHAKFTTDQSTESATKPNVKRGKQHYETINLPTSRWSSARGISLSQSTPWAHNEAISYLAYTRNESVRNEQTIKWILQWHSMHCVRQESINRVRGIFRLTSSNISSGAHVSLITCKFDANNFFQPTSHWYFPLASDSVAPNKCAMLHRNTELHRLSIDFSPGENLC